MTQPKMLAFCARYNLTFGLHRRDSRQGKKRKGKESAEIYVQTVLKSERGHVTPSLEMLKTNPGLIITYRCGAKWFYRSGQREDNYRYVGRTLACKLDRRKLGHLHNYGSVATPANERLLNGCHGKQTRLPRALCGRLRPISRTE